MNSTFIIPFNYWLQRHSLSSFFFITWIIIVAIHSSYYYSKWITIFFSNIKSRNLIKLVILIIENLRVVTFNNVPGSGINVDPKYNLIEIKHTSRYYKYDPFGLAKQALQVYYAPYLSLRRDKIDWSAVFKTKPRFTLMDEIFLNSKLTKQISRKIEE